MLNKFLHRLIRTFLAISMISVIFCTTFFVPVFADNSIASVLEQLKQCKPFTMQYIQKTSELSTLCQKADPKKLSENVKAILAEATSYLDSVVLRVDFLMEDTISRLGSDLDISVKNVDYVKSTMNDIIGVYNMPGFENISAVNSGLYTAIATKIPRIEKLSEQLSLIENSIENLSTQSSEEEIITVVTNYEKLKLDKDLISKQNSAFLSQLIDQAGITEVTYPEQISDCNGLNSYIKDGKLVKSINLLYTQNDIILPVKLQRQLSTKYVLRDSFKLTINDAGGKIPPTQFTIKTAHTKADLIMDSDGRTFKDLDSDPNSFTFEVDKLGDFYLLETSSFYEYSSDFPSRLEWRYQNSALAKLIFDVRNGTSQTVSLNAVNIKTLPNALLNEIAEKNKALELTILDSVVLLPAAYIKLNSKTDFPTIEMLYQYSATTQDKAEFQIGAIPTATEPKPNDIVSKANPSYPPLVRALSIAGYCVALCLIIFLYIKDKNNR